MKQLLEGLMVAKSRIERRLIDLEQQLYCEPEEESRLLGARDELSRVLCDLEALAGHWQLIIDKH